MQSDLSDEAGLSSGKWTTVALFAGAIVVGVLAYIFVFADRTKAALEAEVRAACGGVLNASPVPPPGSNLFADLDFYEQREKDLAGCGATQMKLQMYNAGVDVSDL